MKQKTIKLPAQKRGVHLITDHIRDAFSSLPDAGILHVFLKHTSAGICFGENTDPHVRKDLEDALERMVPEQHPYRHRDEGPDDMPAHIKQTISGATLTVPVVKGQLGLGTWQGIYLCEFRNNGGSREIILTLIE